MTFFLNMVAAMLTIAWGVSYFIVQIGAIAHIMLLMAIAMVLANIVRRRFRSPVTYYTPDNQS